MSQQINLYNPIFLKQEKHFSARTMAQALGVIALALAGLCAYALMEARGAAQTAQQRRAQLTAERDALGKVVARIATQGASKALQAEVEKTEAEVRRRNATLEALGTGELGNTSGFSEFFAAFGRQATSGVWLTGFTVSEAGNDLLVNGRALRADLVPAYLRALSNEEMMRGRRLVDMKLAARSPAPDAKAKSIEPERYIEFSFVAPLQIRSPGKAGTP